MYSFLGIGVFVLSGIEITKDYHLFVWSGVLEKAVELRAKLVLSFGFGLKCWSVHAEKRNILVFLQRKAHGHHALRMSCCRFYSLKTMDVLTVKRTPERYPSVAGFSD